MAALIGLAILGGLLVIERAKDRRSPQLILDPTTPDVKISVRQLKRQLKRWSGRERSLTELLKARDVLIQRGIPPGGDSTQWGRVALARDEAMGMREDLEEALRAVKQLELKKGGLFRQKNRQVVDVEAIEEFSYLPNPIPKPPRGIHRFSDSFRGNIGNLEPVTLKN